MRARLLAAFSLLFIINSVLLVMTLVYGFDSSQKHWNFIAAQDSRKVIRVMEDFLSAEDIGLSSSSCSLLLTAIQSHAQSSECIHLFSEEGEHLQSWTNPLTGEDHFYEADIRKAIPLIVGGETTGHVQIEPLSFRTVKNNELFVTRMIRLTSLGIFLSTLLSVVLALSISSRFTKEAKNTARSLINLASGSRKEEFSSTPTSELSAINEAAETLQSILVKEEERRNRWSLSIAHDLRTPLTAMRTQFTGCRDGVLELNEVRWKKILRELDALESLSRDFLLLGDLEKAAEELRIVRVGTESLKRGIEDSLGAMENDDRRFVWKMELNEIKGDFALLLLALENLIKNALQHMSEPGNISIGFSGTAEKAIICVQNPGFIETEHLPNLFDPLYKTDSSRQKEGNGLGLSIARRIALAHGGDIRVENSDDGQVCFRISLNTGI